MSGLKKIFYILIFLFISNNIYAQNIEDKVIEYKLDNGMKFLLMKRGSAPIFTGYLMFKVGSVDEDVGITGLAHLVEHMAFKGTDVIGTVSYEEEKPILEEINKIGAELSLETVKGSLADSTKINELDIKLKDLQKQHKEFVKNNEFFQIYDANGGVGTNAGTGNDVTSYYVSLPSNKLELWMLMESERIKNPVFREFYVERNVVAEERRLVTDNQPFGKLLEEFIATAFIAHPYGHPIVGWMSDIKTITVEDAVDFYQKYYSPVNGVGVLVGDIEIEKTKKLLDKYFGSIPDRGEPKPVKTIEPEQKGPRKTTVYFKAQPQILIGYHKPTLPEYDDYVFDVIYSILSEGRTSRLYTSLVKEKKLVVGINTIQGLPGARYDNLFVFYAVPRYPHTNQEVEDAIYEEIEKLKTEPASEKELQKVRNRIDANFIRGLDSNQGLASMLAFFEVVADDWKYILRQREIFKKVTPEDIMRVAKKYFIDDNKIIAYLETK